MNQQLVARHGAALAPTMGFNLARYFVRHFAGTGKFQTVSIVNRDKNLHQLFTIQPAFVVLTQQPNQLKAKVIWS